MALLKTNTDIPAHSVELAACVQKTTGKPALLIRQGGETLAALDLTANEALELGRLLIALASCDPATLRAGRAAPNHLHH